MDLARLVDMSAARLKLNIEYDATVVKGMVTLRLGAGVTDRELWELANQLLASRGFTTVRAAGKGTGGGGVISVVKIESAASVARIEVEPRDESVLPVGYESIIYTLKYRSAREGGLVDAVKQLVSKPGGSVAAVGDASLLIGDLTPRLAQTLRLLPMLDAQGEPMVVREFMVQHLSAVQLAAIAIQVAERRDGGSGSGPLSKSGGTGTTGLSGSAFGAGGAGGLLAGPDGKSILIIAPESRQLAWSELLASLDKREPVVVARYVPRYFELRDVARLIDQSIKPVGSGGGGASGGGGGGGGGGGDDRFRVVEDDLTGSLLITATATQHAQIVTLLEQLNASPPDGRRPMKILKVRNREVQDVLVVLQSLVASGSLTASDDPSPSSRTPSSSGATPPDGTARPQPASSGAATSPVTPSTAPGGEPASAILPGGYASARSDARPLRAAASGSRGTGSGSGTSARAAAAPDIVLTADQGTSSIIAVGEPWALAQVERLLKSLDVRQPQVMVQALVVSLSDSQSRNLGIELEGQLNLSADSLLRLSSLFGLSTAGSQAGDRTSTGAGGTSLLLSPGEFAAVIRALESITKGRSMSVPQILVNNNQQAVFNSVVEQPFATRTSASDQLATTSFGGVASAGTVVTAKPQIADGDHLLLTFSVELSSFVGQSANANLPPPKQTNNVSSSVTLPDGFTIAVGGLDLTTQGESEDRVPLISGIPLVGELFKNRSKSSSVSKFYVFLRADVLRRTDFEDLKYLSGLKAGPNEAGVDNGFPAMEPVWIR